MEGSAGGIEIGTTDLIDSVLHDTHRVVRLIGEGGMGAVYEAVHVMLRKKRFAVKVLHARMADNDTIYARFQREAMITSELGHPHIVEVLDFYETDDGRPCMVMEFLEGEDLGARLKDGARMAPAQVALLMQQVGGALQAVHDKGIVHRDMKPGNIFLVGSRDDPLEIKVLDFGISKIQDTNTHLTTDHAVMGTPHYMSPEQGEGQVKDVDHRTDIFALGTICYHALCGSLPFNAPSLLGVLRAICDRPHEPVRAHLPEIGEGVDRVLNRALAKRKQERYGRVDEFVRDLCEALAGSVDLPEEPRPASIDPQLAAADTLPPDRKTMTTGPLPEIVDYSAAAPAPAAVVMDPPGAAQAEYTQVAGLDQVLQQQSGISPMTTLSASVGQRVSPPPVAHAAPRPRPRWQIPAAVAAGVLLPLGVFLALRGGGEEPAAHEKPAVVAARTEPGADPARTKKSEPPAPVEPTASARPAAETSAKEPPEAAGNKAPPAAAAPAPPPPAAGDPKQPVANQPSPSAPPVRPREVAPARATPRRAMARKIRVSLKLSPSSTRVLLNGRPSTQNPLLLTASRNRQLLKFVADGYLPQQRRLVLHQSRTIRVKLQKKRGPTSKKPRRLRFDDLAPAPAKKKKKLRFDDLKP